MFRDNFENYYFREKNEYDVIIYKIKELSDEFILDLKFNRTLDEISNNLMKDVILKKIKEKMNNSIYLKIQNLYVLIDEYKINITKILNQKGTRPLPLDMTHLNELIINYTNLVNNQKNRYYLNISDKPFNILYEFIHNHLEPPLVAIKEQYNSIEERLLNELINILNSFPNYYLRVQEILDLQGMNQNLTLLNSYVNDTIFDYIELLDQDIKSYINKLIHYTYINGLYYQDSPCVGSNCFNESEILDDNDENLRRLNQKEKNNCRLNSLFNFSYLDKEKINKLKNKKLRNLEEYDSTMGSISENDINSYILDMQTILYYFNQSYLDSEYKDINRFSKSYFDKINNTFLFRLKRSIDMVGIRFSTIFTEESYNIFEDKLYEQYNQIVIYINKNSDIIEKTKDEFIDTLNSSSLLLDIFFNISYTKINTYYKILYQSIQDRLKYINKDDDQIQSNILRLLSKKKEFEEKDDDDEPEVDLPKTRTIIIKKDNDKKKITVTVENQKYDSFLDNMFKDAKQSIFSTIKEGESRFKKVKDHFLSNFNKKIKVNIESVLLILAM